MSIYDRVVKVVQNCANVGPDDIKLQSSFMEDLGLDSLDCVELISAIQEEFGIEIPIEQAEKVTTVGEAVDYVTSHLPAN